MEQMATRAALPLEVARPASRSVLITRPTPQTHMQSQIRGWLIAS